MRANRFVSYLGTEIEPKALSTLSQFEAATEKTFQRIEAFSNRGTARLGIGNIGGVDTKSTSAINGTTTALSRARAEAVRTGAAFTTVGGASNAAATGFTRAAQSLSVVQGQLGPLAGRLGSLGTIFRDLAGISLAGVLGGAGAFALANVATSYQKVTDRLRPFYDTQKQTNDAMREVINIARDTRQALDPVAQLYTRIAQASKDAGIKGDTSRLTETVAKAARLSGGDADTQAAGLTQFSQGLGSGTLGGDELKSIRENTFRLAKALADGLGVPIAKLKELGAASKLTPQIITQALARSAAQIDLEFSRLPKRIGASLTEAGNNFGIFIGRLDEGYHATQGFAEAISVLGNNIPTVIAVVGGLGAVFAARALAAPIDQATASLLRFGQVRMATLAGAATAVNIANPNRSQVAGRSVVRAERVRDQALAQAGADQAAVTAQKNILAQLDARAAKIRSIAGMEAEGAAATAAANDRAITRAEVLVASAREQLALARQTSAARAADAASSAVLARNQARAASSGANGRVQQAQARVNSATAAVEGAATGPGSRADRRRAEATATRQLAVAEAELAQAQQAARGTTAALATAEAELAAVRATARTAAAAEAAAVSALAAAELELVVALNAASAATVVGGNAANVAAAKGIGLLAVREQEIIALAAKRAAEIAATASTVVATEAITVAAVAQREYAATLTFTARAQEVLAAGATKLSALLGGPVGIALAGVTIAYTLLASSTNAAKEAGDRYIQAQATLAEKLGTTTDALRNQTAAQRELTLAMAETGLEKAKQNKRDAGKDLAASLTDARSNIDLSSTQGRADFAKLGDVIENLIGGRDSGITFKDLNALRKRQSSAFQGNVVSNALGSNPADTVIKSAGFIQTNIEERDQKLAVQRAQASVNAPALKPINLTGATHRTTEQLKAYAKDAAEGGTKIAQANEAYAKTVSDLDAKLAEKRKAGDFSFDDEYIKQLTAAQTKLNGVKDGERAATAARVAGAKATREATAAVKERLAREDALTNILQRYSGEESAVNSGETAKNKVEGLFRKVEKGGAITEIPTITVDGEAITKAQALSRIVEGMNKPYTDLVKSQQQELDIGKLRLAGLGNEADILAQQLDLEKTLGINREKGQHLSEEQVATLRRQFFEQQKLNDATAIRNRLIDIQARSYGVVQDAVRDLIASPLDAGKIGQSLIQSFKNQVADKLSVELFGDPEQEFRDEMTRGLNSSADNLNTSASSLSTSATALADAAAAIREATQPSELPGLTPSSIGTAAFGGGSTIALPGVDELRQSLDDIGEKLGITPDIVVTANKVAAAAAKPKTPAVDQAKMSIENRYNAVGEKLASKVFGPNSILTKGASKLGTFLSGAGTGLAATSALGIGNGSGGSKIGAAIGGGLGKTLLGGTGGLLSKGLTAISSKLGSFAGPLGAIAGSVIGSVVGGLFKTNKQASSNVSVSAAGVSSTTGVGKGSAERTAATGLGSSTASGLQKIAEALGGDFGSANVSIGYRPGHKDGAYRVDSSGQGKLVGVQAFETEAEAIRYAIVESLKQGAIKGIREGTQRLLKAGNDLDTALNNALKFEQVFKDLKAYTDPVGAAIDDLNTQFESLITLFNQAGASADEFADLQKLYDLKRADAIKSATNAALDSITDFITGLKAGSDSPLSKRTQYENAKQGVDGFRADLAAGKTVDADKLLAALSTFKDASRELNGSGAAFFSDFDTILSLAEKAQANLTSTVPGATGGVNTPSPFDTKPITDATAGTTAAVQDGTQVLAGMLGDILTALGSSGGSVQSAIAALPGYKAA